MIKNNEIPQLNNRACGWLRHIWDKATTKDDWSINGDPLPWWDKPSTSPMCAFPDLICQKLLLVTHDVRSNSRLE